MLHSVALTRALFCSSVTVSQHGPGLGNRSSWMSFYYLHIAFSTVTCKNVFVKRARLRNACVVDRFSQEIRERLNSMGCKIKCYNKASNEIRNQLAFRYCISAVCILRWPRGPGVPIWQQQTALSSGSEMIAEHAKRITSVYGSAAGGRPAGGRRKQEEGDLLSVNTGECACVRECVSVWEKKSQTNVPVGCSFINLTVKLFIFPSHINHVPFGHSWFMH